MGKIKILTAVFGLGGCLVNAFCMQECDNINRQRIPVTINFHNDRSVWATKVFITDMNDLCFHNIDFTVHQITNLEYVLSKSAAIHFFNCKMPKDFLVNDFPKLEKAIYVEFIECKGLKQKDVRAFKDILHSGSKVYYPSIYE
jgi:hypothetical protein